MGDPEGLGASPDSLNTDQPFDPSQWAMHGLLSVWFEAEAGVRTDRIDATLKQIPNERSHPRFAMRPRLAWWLTGLAAAAAVALVFFPTWPFGRTGQALAVQLQQVGLAGPLPSLGMQFDVGDSEAVARVEEAIAAARTTRDQERDAGNTGDTMFAWAKVYRNLRALGRWEEALDEMARALEYAEAEHVRAVALGDGGFSYYYVCLTDLGDTYASLGDYSRALDYHECSLVLARAYEEWLHTCGGADTSLRAVAHGLATSLAPRYWRLSMLAAAQGDLEAAQEYHGHAGQLLTDILRQECTARQLTVGDGAPFYDRCMALVSIDEPSIHTLTVKAREHLVRKARLQRLDKDLDAAAATLHLARTIPYLEWRDESRLDFTEPMEELRIAIAQGDFEAAVAAAADAAENTGAREFPADIGLTRPPIGAIARAELQYLRGVALAGRSADDADTLREALRMIESAIDVVQECAKSIEEPARSQFLTRFAAWQSVVDLIRRDDTPSQDTTSDARDHETPHSLGNALVRLPFRALTLPMLPVAGLKPERSEPSDRSNCLLALATNPPPLRTRGGECVGRVVASWAARIQCRISQSGVAVRDALEVFLSVEPTPLRTFSANGGTDYAASLYVEAGCHVHYAASFPDGSVRPVPG